MFNLRKDYEYFKYFERFRFNLFSKITKIKSFDRLRFGLKWLKLIVAMRSKDFATKMFCFCSKFVVVVSRVYD